MLFAFTRVRFLLVVTLLLLCCSPTHIFADDGESDLVDPGQITFREPMQMQNEEIDPFTGHLLLTNTDLELPANGDLPISMVRTYNSSRLTDTNPKDSILGFGWDLTFGTLQKKGNSVIIELQDGTQSTAVNENFGGNNYITKDFWKVYKPVGGTPTVTMSDGTKITYGEGGSVYYGGKYYATQIKKNNNVINISYLGESGIPNAAAIEKVTYKTNNTSKTIQFHYFAESHHLKSISWGPPNNRK